MRTMGEGGIKRMENFGSFSSFQGTNSGRTLGVFCQHLPLALRGRDCGRRIQRYVERRGRGIRFDQRLVCMRFVHGYFIFLFFYPNTSFPSVRFVASITLGEMTLGSIGQDALSRRDTRKKMSGGGRGC